jgi:hypothetical protein
MMPLPVAILRCSAAERHGCQAATLLPILRLLASQQQLLRTGLAAVTAFDLQQLVSCMM